MTTGSATDSPVARATILRHDVRARTKEEVRARALRYRDLTPSYERPSSPFTFTSTAILEPATTTPNEPTTCAEGSRSHGALFVPAQGLIRDLSPDPTTISLPPSPSPLAQHSIDVGRFDDTGITTTSGSKQVPTATPTIPNEEQAAAKGSLEAMSLTQDPNNISPTDAATGLLTSSALPLDRQSSNYVTLDTGITTNDVAKDLAEVENKKGSDAKKAADRSKENRLQ